MPDEEDVPESRKRRAPTSDGTPYAIEGDHTPVPAKPPARSQFREMTETTQMEALLEAAGRNAAAIAHEQQVRHEGEEIGALKAKVDAIGHVGNEMIAVRQRVDALRGQSDSMERKLDRLLNASASGEGRHKAEREADDQRWGQVFDRMGGVEDRVAELEKHRHADRQVTKALTRVQKAKQFGGVSGVAALLSYLITKLLEHFSH